MKKIFGVVISLIVLLAMNVHSVVAQELVKFDEHFQDATLRLDMIFSGKRGDVRISLGELNKSDHWYGRRHSLNELALQGTGQVNVYDKVTDKLIYCNSFSTLFQEWLSIEESLTRAKAFENVFLLPMPRREVRVEFSLFDVMQKSIAKQTIDINPQDILIRNLGNEAHYEYEYLHRGGKSEDVIDVVILAEGYTKEEMPEFMSFAERSVKDILAHEPFKSHKNDFNFIAVKTTSEASGVSVPRQNDWRKTVFSSHFDTFYSDRYLTSSSQKAVHNALIGIPYEHIIILANTDVYGGGGVFNSFTLTSTKHRAFDPVVVHEFGHSFGGLADEYFYDEDTMTDTYNLKLEPWEQNITTLVDFDGKKWSKLIPQNAKNKILTGTVLGQRQYEQAYPTALFEGGAYTQKKIYRCSYNCRMRTNEYHKFCPACHLALDKLINYYVGRK